MNTPLENRNLSHLGSFDEVKAELGLRVGADHLLRTPEGRIVLFRGQQVDYPDTLKASTDPETSGGIYGDGAYFGNSPAAVDQYALYGDQGIQAYLLPEIDEEHILRMTRYAARRNHARDTTATLQIFPAPIPIEHRVMYTRGEGPKPRLWARVPATAQEIIDGTRKFAYLGHVGIGTKRFGKR